MARALVSVCVLFSSFGLFAAGRPAWTLAPGERVTERLERLRRNVGRGLTGDMIDGKATPHLFLPGELMALFLSEVQQPDPAVCDRHRQSYNSALIAFGWDPGRFWRDFDSHSTEYRELTRPDEDGMVAANQERSRRGCAARVAALAAMRRDYARFDEFLYTAFAPRSGMMVDPSATEEWLLWLEGGCK